MVDSTGSISNNNLAALPISQELTEEARLSAPWIEHAKAKECWRQLIANGSLQIEQKGSFLIIKSQKAVLSLQSATAVETLIEVCAENRTNVTSFEFHRFQFLDHQSNHTLRALATKLRQEYHVRGVAFEECQFTGTSLEEFMDEIDIPLGHPPVFQNFKTLSICSQLIDETFIQALAAFIKCSRVQNRLFLNNCHLNAEVFKRLAAIIPPDVRFPSFLEIGHQNFDDALLEILAYYIHHCMIGGQLNLVNCRLNALNVGYIGKGLVQQEQDVLNLVINPRSSFPIACTRGLDLSGDKISILRHLNLSSNSLFTEAAVTIFAAGKQLDKINFSNCGIHCLEFISLAFTYVQEGIEIVLSNNIYDQNYPLFLDAEARNKLNRFKKESIKLVLDNKPETNEMYQKIQHFFVEFPAVKVVRVAYQPPKQYNSVVHTCESSVPTTQVALPLPVGVRSGDVVVSSSSSHKNPFVVGAQRGVDESQPDELTHLLTHTPVGMDIDTLKCVIATLLEQPNSIVDSKSSSISISLPTDRKALSPLIFQALLECIFDSQHAQTATLLAVVNISSDDSVIMNHLATFYNRLPAVNGLVLRNCSLTTPEMQALLKAIDRSKLEKFLLLNQTVTEEYMKNLMKSLEPFNNLKNVVFQLLAGDSQCTKIVTTIDDSDCMCHLKGKFPNFLHSSSIDIPSRRIEYSCMVPKETINPEEKKRIENLKQQLPELAIFKNSKTAELIDELFDKNLSSETLKKLFSHPVAKEKSQLFKILLQTYFSINNVSSDGDCVYSSFLNTVDSLKAIYQDVEELRSAVADYFEANPQPYLAFITPEYSMASDKQQRIQETAKCIRQHAYFDRPGFWAGDLELSIISNFIQTLTINRPLYIYDVEHYDPKLAGTYIQNGMLMPPPNLIYNGGSDKDPIYLLRSENHYNFLTKLRVGGKHSNESSKDRDVSITKWGKMGE